MLRLYAAIGVVIALLAGYGAWQSNKAATALEKVDAMSAQLSALQRGVDASNEAIGRLDAAMVKVSAKAATVRERVITMERENAAVRSFLDIPVPDAGCMLDDTCATGGPQHGAIAPVLTAPTTGE